MSGRAATPVAVVDLGRLDSIEAAVDAHLAALVSNPYCLARMIEVAEGNFARGEKLLARSAGESDAPLLNYLQAAITVRDVGDAVHHRDVDGVVAGEPGAGLPAVRERLEGS